MNRAMSLGLVCWTIVSLSVPGRADNIVLNFGPEEIVKAQGQEIVVPGYSVPSFVDWNNDHLQDLVVGEGGGSAPGKIRVYLNRGTEADPCFADFFYVQVAGQDLTLPAQDDLGCFPRVLCWDADQRQDLLVGLADGTVQVFPNIGTDNEPAFGGGTTLKVGVGAAQNLNVGQRATPVVVDWNNDGMLDVVAGGWDGMIHLYYNCGCGGSVPPRFSLSTPIGLFAQDSGHNLVVPSARSSPVIMDLDGDGKKDLLTGNTNGQILFYRNTGKDTAPAFSGYTLVQSNGVPIHLPGALRSRPFLCHWTGEGHFGPKDGYWDLLVGYGDGKIHLYRGLPKAGDFNGDGVLDGADLTLLVQALDQPVPPGGSPCDLNHDGQVNVLDLRLFADLWLAEHGAANN